MFRSNRNRFAVLVVMSVVAASSIALSGCEKKETTTFSNAEVARTTALENATWNAEVYRNNSPRLDTLKVVPHGDDTIDNDCPWGSGWAQISIMGDKAHPVVDPTTGTKSIEKYVVFCSTVSAARGCYIEKDFKDKPFGKDFGHCAAKGTVPYPIAPLRK